MGYSGCTLGISIGGKSLDWKVVLFESKEFYIYSPPQHPDCRSIRVFIHKDETFQPELTGIPKSIPVKTWVFAPETMKK